MIKKSLTFYKTRRFITMPTAACHWTLSWATSTQTTSITHPTFLVNILILSSYPHLISNFTSFPLNLQTKHCLYFLCPPYVLSTLPLHTLFLKYLFNINFPSKSKFPRCYKPLMFLAKIIHHISWFQFICLAHYVLIITLIMLCDEWNLLSYSLQNCLQFSVSSSFLSTYGQD
jgi:hypothetical protein